MLGDILDRLNTEENRRAIDEKVVAPLFSFLWDKYSRQYTIVRNAFFFIAVLLVAQLAISMLIYRRVCTRPP